MANRALSQEISSMSARQRLFATICGGAILAFALWHVSNYAISYAPFSPVYKAMHAHPRTMDTKLMIEQFKLMIEQFPIYYYGGHFIVGASVGIFIGLLVPRYFALAAIVAMLPLWYIITDLALLPYYILKMPNGIIHEVVTQCPILGFAIIGSFCGRLVQNLYIWLRKGKLRSFW